MDWSGCYCECELASLQEAACHSPSGACKSTALVAHSEESTGSEWCLISYRCVRAAVRGRGVGPVTVTPAQALWSLCSRVWWDVTETGNTSASWDSGGEAALEIGAWTYFIWGENTWEGSGCAGDARGWHMGEGTWLLYFLTSGFGCYAPCFGCWTICLVRCCV